tara:strand:+ start:275 stop:1105 length:831 start_codon:yes stop_codon:yes gene_type:complete
MGNSKADETKKLVQAVIDQLMEGVLKRVLSEDPFVPAEHEKKKPLYAALVPEEIWKGSHFERRFTTPFGHVWEKLAQVVAENAGDYAEREHSITGVVKRDRLGRIGEILNNLEHSKKGDDKVKPDWGNEIKYILKGKGPDIPVTVICDLYTENRSNSKKYAYEIKAPLPNSDQTKVSKEKILKLHCMRPKKIDHAYYALPYNPFGSKKVDYKWSFPNRWFNMQSDEVVLIGKEFWDTIGGIGAYQGFVDAIREIGPKYKDIIYRKFLGVEPPKNLK